MISARAARVQVLCAHNKDHGAHCDAFCEHVAEWQFEGPRCGSAWAPEDIGVYLWRETQECT